MESRQGETFENLNFFLLKLPVAFWGDSNNLQQGQGNNVKALTTMIGIYLRLDLLPLKCHRAHLYQSLLLRSHESFFDEWKVWRAVRR